METFPVPENATEGRLEPEENLLSTSESEQLGVVSSCLLNSMDWDTQLLLSTESMLLMSLFEGNSIDVIEVNDEDVESVV